LETVTPPAPQILEDDELVARLLGIYHRGVAAGAAKANTTSPGAKANTTSPGAKANTSSPDAKANTSSPGTRTNTASPPPTVDQPAEALRMLTQVTRQKISGSTGYHQLGPSRRIPGALDPTCRATPVSREPFQPTGRAIPGQKLPTERNPAKFATPSTGEPTSHRYHQHPIQGRPTNLHHRAHARPQLGPRLSGSV
ncbi:hypothetical protein QE152_g39835, partial [Popillia japonica]